MVVLARLLQHVRVARIPAGSDPRAVPLVTLRPEGGLELLVSRRG